MYFWLNLSSNYNLIKLRGCTGFDGGFEIAEAIRRLGLRHQLRNKYKRKRQFTISCRLMAACRP